MTANPPAAPAALRLRLGLALGALGDGRLNATRPALCRVPAGVFRMGTSEADKRQLKEQGAQSWDNEKPDHEVYVSEFIIGKYPVTSQEFREFVDAGGYENPGFWSEDGWNWRTGRWDSDLSYLTDEKLRQRVKEWLDRRSVALRSRPYFWDDPQWNGANLPVVGVCWFEAEAYCRWLSAATGESYRLPSEAEWEKAARSDPAVRSDPAARSGDGRLWSWGSTWEAENCNNSDEAVKEPLRRTSPVGMYPQGQSPCGAEDMLGNVWEWCLDWYAPDTYKNRVCQPVEDPQGPEHGTVRILRGGSWNDYRSDARCAFRRRLVPVSFNISVGFRLVCSPSTSDL